MSHCSFPCVAGSKKWTSERETDPAKNRPHPIRSLLRGFLEGKAGVMKASTSRIIDAHKQRVLHAYRLYKRGRRNVHPWQFCICLSCAQIFKNSSRSRVLCPICHFVCTRQHYEELLLYARDAVYFGLIYRDTYEQDVRHEGKWETHRAIPINHSTLELLAFAGLAAVSGIIGNASYDLVKTVIQRVREHPLARRRSDLSNHDQFLNVIDEGNIRHFLSRMKAHTNDYRGVNPKVRERLKQEQIVHVLAPVISGRTPCKNIVVSQKTPTKRKLAELWRCVRQYRTRILR